MNRLLAATLAATMITTAACQRAEGPIPDEVPQGSTAVSTTSPPPLTGEMWLDDFTLGSILNDEGRIALGTNDDEFVAGEPVYFAMEVGDAPPGTSVRVVWYGADGSQMHEETKVTAAGSRYMHFQAPETSAWPAGTYRVEAYAGHDQLVNSVEFSVSRNV